MNWSIRNVLCILNSFFDNIVIKPKWAIFIVTPRSLLLHRLRALILLLRFNWFALSFLCWQLSSDSFNSCSYINIICSLLWRGVYVPWGLYKSIIVPLKYVCYQCSLSFHKLRLFSNHDFLRMYRFIFTPFG